MKAPGASVRGQPYLLAASLASRSGIEVRGGVVPLNADALFTLSLGEPAWFVEFLGTLDGAGEADALLRVPPFADLVSFAFQVAFVAIPPGGGDWVISNPATVRIE